MKNLKLQITLMNIDQLLNWLKDNRKNNSLVLVTGVFDLLHEEHLQFLHKAKQKGDLLLVGLESDLRVKQLKGENRPIWNEDRRVVELEHTKIADAVFILPEQFSKPVDHEKLISQIKPDFLAVSSHTAHQDKKKALVEKYGGKLAVVLEHNPNISTSQKILEG